MLNAVPFDVDGVVADSHPIHEAAWKTLLMEQGLDAETSNLKFLNAGHSPREILRHDLGSLDLQGMERLGRRRDELYANAVDEPKPKPDMSRALSQLCGNGILYALAASAESQRAHETLERFGSRRHFSAIATSENDDLCEPAPDRFLMAAAKLGMDAVHCIVAGNPVAGVAAARAAESQGIRPCSARACDRARKGGS